MREARRSPAAVRWLLALTLGLLGLAGAPAAGALSPGALSTGALSTGELSTGALAGPPAAAVGAVATATATGRTATARAATERASSPRPAHAVPEPARHHTGPSAPVTPGAFAPAGPDVRPALVRTVRPAAGFTEPVVAATGAPRGRAPPTTRI
ncbi:hypothetical protein amrb99_25680 [Actinomadura sp. RB99]|uniref:hypothetical protein n=1 Tax=Actinomadura sp. RB99 TaxID=2691577 RepID=UPI0016887424|nr:hypothetical protein [Actinomadura sp. RB99]MBD2893646.1 hypothetical protein [Actinomadura sp. RB99]